jgi:hypothetical protein
MEKGGRNILRFFEAAFDLKAVHSGLDQSVEKRGGVQIAGRYGILIAGDSLSVDDDVVKKTTALRAASAVSRTSSERF